MENQPQFVDSNFIFFYERSFSRQVPDDATYQSEECARAAGTPSDSDDLPALVRDHCRQQTGLTSVHYSYRSSFAGIEIRRQNQQQTVSNPMVRNINCLIQRQRTGVMHDTTV